MRVTPCCWPGDHVPSWLPLLGLTAASRHAGLVAAVRGKPPEPCPIIFQRPLTSLIPALGHAAPDLLGLDPAGALNPARKDQPWQLGVMPHGAWVDLVPQRGASLKRLPSRL